MHPTEGPHGGPKRGARPLTGVAVPRTPALSSSISRPRMHPVTDRRMARMTPPIARPRIGIQRRADGWHMLRAQGRAGACIGTMAAPKARLARGPRHHTMMGGRSLA